MLQWLRLHAFTARMLRAQVQSLVRELRSCKLHVIAKKINKQKKEDKKICRDFVRISSVYVSVCCP